MTPELASADLASPSLRRPGGAGPAFEMKFLLDEVRAAAVEGFIRRRLTLDPHGDPALGGAYHTSTLYCDTAAFDVYNRKPSYKRRKFRIRRYGTMDAVFLEQKAKWGDRVDKRRTRIPEADLGLLAAPDSSPEWPACWFHRRLTARALRPACLMNYQRTAYVGLATEGPLRLTLDRHVRGTTFAEWGLPPLVAPLPLLTGQVILEFKFRSALPVLFKEVLEQWGLGPCPVSKYRACIGALGVAEGGEAVDA